MLTLFDSKINIGKKFTLQKELNRLNRKYSNSIKEEHLFSAIKMLNYIHELNVKPVATRCSCVLNSLKYENILEL